MLRSDLNLLIIHPTIIILLYSGFRSEKGESVSNSNIVNKIQEHIA